MVYIIVIGILILAILFIVFKINSDKIKDLSIKNKEASASIELLLNKKLELLMAIVNEIESISDNKYKDELSIVTDENLESVDLNERLNEVYNRILEIVVFNAEIVLSDSGYTNLANAKKTTLELSGVEKYYNENATSYNSLISKLPNSLLKQIKKYKKLELYKTEKKEIFEMLQK